MIASHLNLQPGGPECSFLSESGVGDSTSSYTNVNMVLRIIGPHKPHHFDKVEMPSGGIVCVYKILECHIPEDWSVIFISTEHIRFYKTGFEIVCIFCAQTCSISVVCRTVLNLPLPVKKITKQTLM